MGTNVATNGKLVYITLTTCRGHLRAQNGQNHPDFSENEAKEPLFPGYCRRQSKNSEKARNTGNPWGGGVAAPRPSWIVWRMAKTCPVCSLTRLTDYHRKQPMPGNQYTRTAKGGEIFAPCAKSVFHQKK